MLNPRRAKTWQMRINTPGRLLTSTDKVCTAWSGEGATGVSVVTIVCMEVFSWKIEFKVRWHHVEAADHVEPVGLAILYFGGSMSMSSSAAPAGIIGKTLSVLMHSA